MNLRRLALIHGDIIVCQRFKARLKLPFIDLHLFVLSALVRRFRLLQVEDEVCLERCVACSESDFSKSQLLTLCESLGIQFVWGISRST